MAHTVEQGEREAAIRIAASFFAGRDGVGTDKLFRAAEQVREYILHGDGHISARRSSRTR